MEIRIVDNHCTAMIRRNLSTNIHPDVKPEDNEEKITLEDQINNSKLVGYVSEDQVYDEKICAWDLETINNGKLSVYLSGLAKCNKNLDPYNNKEDDFWKIFPL